MNNTIALILLFFFFYVCVVILVVVVVVVVAVVVGSSRFTVGLLRSIEKQTRIFVSRWSLSVYKKKRMKTRNIKTIFFSQNN